jgi:hypothetical protein
LESIWPLVRCLANTHHFCRGTLIGICET